MGKASTLQQRIEIVERARAGENDAAIGKALGLSRWTVRKWRRKGTRQGPTGLVSEIGRPAKGALSSFARTVVEWLAQTRQQHPGWGPLTLRTEMTRAPQLAGQRLPQRTQIAAYLQEKGLTRAYQHHTQLVQPKKTVTVKAHEKWELDAQGVQKVAGLGEVVVINVLDVYTRVKVESCACVGTSKAATEDYQLACRRAFLRYGLPLQMSLDHDGTFYDSQVSSPYPLRFHLWLIALGIKVYFIRYAPPREHSGVERMHAVMTQQALAGQAFTDTQAVQRSLDARRYFLNMHYPAQGKARMAPLQSFPQARYSGRPYTPDTERQLLDLQRVYAYLAQHSWFRRTSGRGQFYLGHQRYGVGMHMAKQELRITFDPQHVQFVCHTSEGQVVKRCAPLGLSKADLMGELSPGLLLPAYQPRLPLFPGACREAILYQDVSGTPLPDFTAAPLYRT